MIPIAFVGESFVSATLIKFIKIIFILSTFIASFNFQRLKEII